MEIPFVGGAYTEQSVNVNAQKCVNLFPVMDNEQAKNKVVLHSTPGLSLFGNITTTTSAIRGMCAFGSVIYSVLSATVYSTTTAGVSTSLGDISTSAGNVYFANNGTEVLIVDGTDTGFLITSGVLAEIADADFPVATSCTFQDGYFIVTSDSGRIYISALYDGTSWDALDFTTAEANPDDALCVISNSHDLWVIGEVTSQTYYNSGDADFPFTLISGAVIDLGTVSAATVVNISGVMFWLTDKKSVIKTQGYQYVTVSTIHIEYEFSTYTTVSDAKAFTYSIAGHVFYALTFPTEDKTWVYDTITDLWHEWESYSTVSENTLWGRHRGNCGVRFQNKEYVGDYENGNIYELSLAEYTDNSHYIRRIRVNPVVNTERYLVKWHRLEIDFESGVGLTGGVQGEDPQVMLQWSDDGGHTWSNEHWVAIGKIGEYKTRAVWRRLGKSRNRVLRIIVSDPVNVVILGAYAELEKCEV